MSELKRDDRYQYCTCTKFIIIDVVTGGIERYAKFHEAVFDTQNEALDALASMATPTRYIVVSLESIAAFRLNQKEE